ncbi:2Fe-2S iron-sulfur cluster-binding protein [Gordonia sp. CPCC 206044]|uniref:2Fe-2S iron-sulfur cluster-binding protein n=1 Tax=Gordonia sp. CPCC 206044 TaxID=3140793 RepID=UPI003AF3D988
MSDTDTAIGITVTDRDGIPRRVDWEEGQSLMEALRDNDFPILASCGGTASCATCHVYLPEQVVDRLGERSDDELELLEDADAYDPNRSRLACQVGRSGELNELNVVLAPEED